MKFLILILALATVGTAQQRGRSGGRSGGNVVFEGSHGYHHQSFNIQGGSSGGSGNYESSSRRVAAVAARPVAAVQLVQQPVATVQLVALQAVQGHSAGISRASSASHSSGPITAAVQSRHHVEYVDVPSTGGGAPQSIIIPPSTLPLDFEFQSQSSPISVRQSHIPGQPNPPQSSSHTDEPDVLRQEIVKPIIHEVTEAIQPIRKITQEVRPVEETVNQLISRGQQQQQHSAVRAQSHHQAQSIAVQAIPVQAVAVQAAPVQAQLQTVQTNQLATGGAIGGGAIFEIVGLDANTLAQLGLTGSQTTTTHHRGLHGLIRKK